MHDLFREMERVCERNTKELHDFLDRIDQNKNTISPADLEILCKLVDIAKNSKSTMKKIMEIEDMEQMNGEYSGNMYSGNMMYRNEPMWDRRYSGNSYHGQYTIATGDGRNDYSGRNMRQSYSRGNDTRMELEEMLNSTRDPQEAETLRKIINRL